MKQIGIEENKFSFSFCTSSLKVLKEIFLSKVPARDTTLLSIYFIILRFLATSNS